MWKLLLVPVLAYAAILLAVWAMQTRILFPAALAGAAGPLPAGAIPLVLDTAEGHRLRGVHIPASSGRGTTAPVVLGFGGNAWNAQAVASYLHDLYPEADVVAFHYRGYAPSAGTPGAEALVADAPLVHDFAAAHLPGRPVVAVGFSIGGGIAAALAARRQLAGLILVTPFDSLERVAAGHYPWLPVRWLLRHRLDAAAALAETRVPVAILAAERDRLVPPARTDALRRAVANLAFDRTIPAAGHNDIYDRPAFRQAMREALAAIR
jgi:pimeloyl-ACP methyl ester carboxylesterase